jgi:hypothetical protein
VHKRRVSISSFTIFKKNFAPLHTALHSPVGLPTVTINEAGTVIQGQRQPNITTNTWAASPSNVAPFNLDTCYTATGPVNGVYRSMRVFCDVSTLPAIYNPLPRYDNRSTIPVPTTPPSALVNLQFDPPIADPQCINVHAGSTDPLQTYVVYWSGPDARFSSCSGDPSFIAVGGTKNCFQAEYQGSQRGYIDLMALYCNADR